MPNLVGKDILNPQSREISSLPFKMGGFNIKLQSYQEICLKCIKKTSLVLEFHDTVTAIN